MNVFVSYAHGGRDWSPERRDRWQRMVLDFAVLLRGKVRVELDRFRAEDPEVDWTRWGARAVEKADVVVIAGNAEYWKRWRGENLPDEGAGVAREADALLGLYHRDQRAFQRKVVVAILPGEDRRAIPYDLVRAHTFPITTLDRDGVAPLLRRCVRSGSSA